MRAIPRLPLTKQSERPPAFDMPGPPTRRPDAAAKQPEAPPTGSASAPTVLDRGYAKARQCSGSMTSTKSAPGRRAQELRRSPSAMSRVAEVAGGNWCVHLVLVPFGRRPVPRLGGWMSVIRRIASGHHVGEQWMRIAERPLQTRRSPRTVGMEVVHRRVARGWAAIHPLVLTSLKLLSSAPLPGPCAMVRRIGTRDTGMKGGTEAIKRIG